MGMAATAMLCVGQTLRELSLSLSLSRGARRGRLRAAPRLLGFSKMEIFLMDFEMLGLMCWPFFFIHYRVYDSRDDWGTLVSIFSQL